MDKILTSIFKNKKDIKNIPIGDPSKFNNGIKHPLVVLPNTKNIINTPIGDPSKFNNGIMHPIVVLSKK